MRHTPSVKKLFQPKFFCTEQEACRRLAWGEGLDVMEAWNAAVRSPMRQSFPAMLDVEMCRAYGARTLTTNRTQPFRAGLTHAAPTALDTGSKRCLPGVLGHILSKLC